MLLSLERAIENAISFLFISKAYEVIKLLQEGIPPYLS